MQWLAVILTLIPALCSAQGDLIISGKFDVSGPVRIVAVSTADTLSCRDLYRGTHSGSYTFQIENVPGITVFFAIEGKTKRMHIPHMSGDETYFGLIDVLFKKNSDYLIFRPQKRKRAYEHILH